MDIFKSADILIPKEGTDFSKWSVVACDQYTSEPEYWADVKNIVGDSVSTLNMIFPEVYLEDDGADERIAAINKTMGEYLSGGVFEELKDAYIYVEREQSDGKIRRGVVGMVDLDAYDYSKDSQSPVRATEGTIIERIPPRQRVRRNAPLELPHIMLLAEDINNEIIAPLVDKTGELRKIYDFKLMQDSGHIKGWLIGGAAKSEFDAALDALLMRKNAEKLPDGKRPLIFAVGDGNHSLATAKSCWEELKKTLTPEQAQSHPSRYALCELVNLYDSALVFEPIHRVVFDIEPSSMMNALFEYYPEASHEKNGGQEIRYVYGDKSGTVYIKGGKSNIPVGSIQAFIDDYISQNGGRVDYIHGEDVTKRLAASDGAIGFMVDAMDKTDLYPTVIADGSLPRKTFSMGEAADKRFYLEAKKIK